MTMKILNRFIDDCVNVFQYRFMDTFQYFKERNKNKYLGDRFEEWVVKNSNISKDGCSDLDTGKIFWRLLDWRGDKYVEGYRPLSSSSPDLLLECAVDRSRIYKVGEIIAVECKWRSKVGFYLDRKDIEPGPDGGLVVLDDTTIFERALQILAENEEVSEAQQA